MSSGRLGAEDLAATTDTTIYTVPASTVATVCVNVCNRNASNVTVRLAAVDGLIGALTDADYFEYNTILLLNEALERTGIVMSAGQTIVAYSDTANVSVQVWGWEEGV